MTLKLFKNLNEKNNFVLDSSYFFFFFQSTQKKKREKEEEKYVYKMVSPKIKKVDGKNKKRIFVNSTVRIDFY